MDEIMKFKKDFISNNYKYVTHWQLEVLQIFCPSNNAQWKKIRDRPSLSSLFYKDIRLSLFEQRNKVKMSPQWKLR